jgi:hypothetical protein
VPVIGLMTAPDVTPGAQRKMWIAIVAICSIGLAILAGAVLWPKERVGSTDTCIHKLSSKVDFTYLEAHDITVTDLGGGSRTLGTAILSTCEKVSPSTTVDDAAGQVIAYLKEQIAAS